MPFEQTGFLSFFGMSPDAMLVVDSQGRIVLVNQPAEQLLGYSAEELHLKPIESVIPERYREAHRAQRCGFARQRKRRAMDSGLEFVAITREGVELPLSISLCRLDSGGEEYTVATFHFNEAESRFRQLAENIQEVFWLTTPDKHEMLYISPAYERVWGRSCKTLLESPSSWMEDIIPEDRERVMREVALQSSGKYNVEYRIRNPDGKIRWIRDRAFPVKNKSGQIYRIAGVAEDVTESKRIQSELLESELRRKEAQRNARIGSWELDIASGRHSWSEELFRIFEMDGQEVAPACDVFFEMIHPEDRDAVILAYRRHLEENVPYGITHRLCMPDGRIKHVAEQRRIEFGENGLAMRSMGAIQDVTELKRMEKELIDRRRELDELQKWQVVTQTISAIAHELNQPLFAISAYNGAAIRMLEEGNSDCARLARILESAGQQAERAGHSIREMLEFLNDRDHASEAFDLKEIILNALSYVRSDREANFHCALRIEENLPPVFASPIHIKKVLVNLIHNGLEAMEEAGVEHPSITLSARAHPDEGVIQVSVKDIGPGLSDTRKIFEPFHTTKQKGIGMGLAISRSLIETQEGNLWFEAGLGSGATFHFTIPLAT
ncbi:MAG: PAS domain S-box protein [Burkholderiales bacterium]|nr:PAS domain S-box protein [Burkholderiales bacterium]